MIALAGMWLLAAGCGGGAGSRHRVPDESDRPGGARRAVFAVRPQQRLGWRRLVGAAATCSPVAVASGEEYVNDGPADAAGGGGTRYFVFTARERGG